MRTKRFTALSLVTLAAILAAFAPAAHPSVAVAAGTAPAPRPLPSPDQMMFLIRRQFLSHRPPPPYETYTLVRSQMTDYGFPDPVNSYTWHVWCRTYDDACLERQRFKLGAVYPMTFKRPRFNIADDPGPPTADVFQRKPLTEPKVSDVPTPEPTGPPPKTIAEVSAIGEFDYRIGAVVEKDGMLDITLVPRRDPERNLLREIWVDPQTWELKRIIAHDTLFVQGDKNYPVVFDYTLGYLEGHPVITQLHGTVGGGYDGDGKDVDFYFKDITFPSALPAWYFDPSTYASHVSDAPK